MVASALMLVSKYILEYVRYSDNILYSFQTLEEYEKVKKDLEESFSKYSLPLKYLITSVENDPKVMEDPKRGPDKIEKTMGLLWDIVEDTILALQKYKFNENNSKSLSQP